MRFDQFKVKTAVNPMGTVYTPIVNKDINKIPKKATVEKNNK